MSRLQQVTRFSPFRPFIAPGTALQPRSAAASFHQQAHHSIRRQPAIPSGPPQPRRRGLGSDFGFRTSFGLRISSFGFDPSRRSPHFSLPIPGAFATFQIND
jgi:hypothetical protein